MMTKLLLHNVLAWSAHPMVLYQKLIFCSV